MVCILRRIQVWTVGVYNAKKKLFITNKHFQGENSKNNGHPRGLHSISYLQLLTPEQQRVTRKKCFKDGLKRLEKKEVFQGWRKSHERKEISQAGMSELCTPRFPPSPSCFCSSQGLGNADPRGRHQHNKPPTQGFLPRSLRNARGCGTKPRPRVKVASLSEWPKPNFLEISFSYL